MAEVNGGTPQDSAAATPSEGQTTSEETVAAENLSKIQAENRELKDTVDRIREFYKANPDLVQFVEKYADDPEANKLVKSYLDGGTVTTPTTESADVEPDSGSPVVVKALEDKIADLKDQLAVLQQHFSGVQVDQLKSKYSKDAGFPFSFEEKAQEIAQMLRDGRALNAEQAYFEILGREYLGLKSEHDKALLEQKRKSSMSRYRTPSMAPIKGPAEKPKSFAEALVDAEEKAGMDILNR